MHLHELDLLPAHEALLLAADRRDVFDLLWLRRDLLRAALAAALPLAVDPDAPHHPAATAFVTRALAHVRSPDEYVALCTLLDGDPRHDLLGLTHKLHALDPRVLVALLEDPALLATLAPGPLWSSDALWTRATWLFAERQGHRFTIAELVPAAVPPDTRARHVLGAALDAARLTPDAIQQLRALYPSDRHIQARTAASP